MSTQNLNPIAEAVQGWYFTAGDGKGIVVADTDRMVRISQAVPGKKGKGKTVQTVNIPKIVQPLTDETLRQCEGLVVHMLNELQTDIVQRMGKDGAKAVSENDISVNACLSEFINRKMSAENIGIWFDADVSDDLAFAIITAKGLNAENLSKDQQSAVENLVAAYRGSYCECASKFPNLDPSQIAELLRVLSLLELTGPVPDAIRAKITPKQTKTALGF